MVWSGGSILAGTLHWWVFPAVEHAESIVPASASRLQSPVSSLQSYQGIALLDTVSQSTAQCKPTVFSCDSSNRPFLFPFSSRFLLNHALLKPTRKCDAHTRSRDCASPPAGLCPSTFVGRTTDLDNNQLHATSCAGGVRCTSGSF